MSIRALTKGLICTSVIACSLMLLSCDTTPSACAHKNMTSTAIPPTHGTEGKTVYVCADCNEYTYSAAFVPPIDHTLVKTVHKPSCTEEGYTEYACDCGYNYTSDYIAPLGHTLTSQTVEPTCDSEGYTASDCSVCGFHYTHDIKAPLGHDLTVSKGYVSVKNGTASTHYKCSRCTLDYDGDFLLYRDIYTGAYVDATEPLSKGIDVSKWNHNTAADGSYLPLNWAKIKEAGYDFVILRAGYMDSTFVIDPVFEMDYAGAKAAGLNVGAYIYSYAYTQEDARTEAKELIRVLDGKQLEYPIFFDIEYSDAKITEKNLTPRAITDICIEFISAMQENGYYTALYTNNKWLTEYFMKTEVAELFDIWYARYAASMPDDKNEAVPVINDGTWNFDRFGEQMTMWQFSETGTIEGIVRNDGKSTPTYFDLNYCYKDYPTLIRQYGLNGYGEQKNLSNLDGLYSEVTE